MGQIYHIGNCPVCGNYGRMEILFDTSSSKCFVMCEECDLEFTSISDYQRLNVRRMYFNPNEEITSIRSATLDEIMGTEWYPFIADKF